MRHAQMLNLSLVVGMLLLLTLGCGRLNQLRRAEQTPGNNPATGDSPTGMPTKATSGPGDKEGRSACSLITDGEMASVLNDSVAQTNDQKTVCFYFMQHGGRPMLMVSWDLGKAGFEISRGAYKMFSKPVTGLGDEAVYASFGVLVFRKGDVVVTVDLRGFKGAEQKSKILAQKVLEKL